MEKSVNELYPVFLKAHKLNILLVGAGSVGLEKLQFLLKSSPRSRLRIVAVEVAPEVQQIVRGREATIDVFERAFCEDDLEEADIVIAATNDRGVNQRIRELARKRHLLVNVADTPDLCDFYLGSIVTRGDLKIAISTNGKSPIFAKRLREILEEALPDSIPRILIDLKKIRDRLQGDFGAKVRKLNEITSILAERE